MAFDVADAISAVREGFNEREEEVRQQVANERDAADTAAREYAAHLADGGDPADHPKVLNARWGERMLISATDALYAVYLLWNAERGSTNTVSPIHNRGEWNIAEHLHGRVGEAIPLQQLAQVGRMKSLRLATPDEVRRAVGRATTDEFVAEKGKLGGKVAYRLRRLNEGETHPGRIQEDAFALDAIPT